jgi:hypothetical protein
MFTSDEVFDLNDNNWELRFTTLPSFEDKVNDEGQFLLLIAGLLTSALIFVLVISLVD